MTVAEMLARISSRELTGWMALARIEEAEREAERAERPGNAAAGGLTG